MKKLFILFCAAITAQITTAQVQYKIADPSIDGGVAELKKADFYKKQIADLGFTDKDVTIKTYPLWKFYSEAAGIVTKSLVEADGAAFHVEATTKKNAKGVIYKMEGNIIFRRCDVAADDFGAYNAKLRNDWRVYHLNVTDFIPANQDYIVAPDVVKTLLITGLSDGSIAADFIPIAASGGEYYDLINLRNIEYITNDKAEYSEFKTEVFNAKEQRMSFKWDLEIALFSADSSYINQIEEIKGLICKVYVNTNDGQPKISKCNFNYGDKKDLFHSTGPNDACDTLFAGMKRFGFVAVNGQRKTILSPVLDGDAKAKFLASFAEAFTKLTGKETSQELETIFSSYATPAEVKKIIANVEYGFKSGFGIVKMDDYDSYRITWEAKTKAAKKMTTDRPGKYEIHNYGLSYFKLINGKYLYESK